MARALNKPAQLINQIKQGERQMPVGWAPLIEEATSALGTPILCEDLAPSVNWSYLRNAAATVGEVTTPTTQPAPQEA